MGSIVLALQDCPSAIKALRKSASTSSYSVLVVSDLPSFFHILGQISVDLIVIGAHLENESLFDTLFALKSQPQWSEIPCIITRARNTFAAKSLDCSMKLAALTFGAQDYVVLEHTTEEELKVIISDNLYTHEQLS